jgi:hypothetical protein
MIGGILGAITGLVGAGLQAKAANDQLMLGYAQFYWQKQQADKQNRFAQAARSDMYGNKTKYDELTNEWNINLTPDQTKLRDLGQREQILQLSEDAPAARKQKRAIQQRAKEAKEPYRRASLGYQYNLPKSEDAIMSEITGLMATGDQARSKADQATLMRQAARLGRGGDAQSIINATDANLGEDTGTRLAKARAQALMERSQRLQMHEAEYGKPMEMWGNLMAQGGDTPGIPKSSLNADLNGVIAEQAKAMQGAMASGNAGISGAYKDLIGASGKSPDLSSVVKALSSIDSRKGLKRDEEEEDQWGGVSSHSKTIDDRSSYGW